MRLKLRLQIAAIFLSVGLGALTVTLLRDPAALIPGPPYGPWILVRVLMLCSLGILGLLLVMGLLDDPAELEDAGGALDPNTFRRAVGLAFLVSLLASATFVAASALVDYLDRSL